MNVFYLDRSPEIAAKYHCDKHVVKMIVETAQLLSTAHRVLDGRQVIYLSDKGRKTTKWSLNDDRDIVLYKATHINHPSAKWVRHNMDTYYWTYKLFLALLSEYTARYGKTHSCARLVDHFKFPRHIKHRNDAQWVEPPLAMPDHCKLSNAVDSYRNYYKIEKRYFAKWKNGNVPEWF